jgi:hypothetical protein
VYGSSVHRRGAGEKAPGRLAARPGTTPFDGSPRRSRYSGWPVRGGRPISRDRGGRSGAVR